MKPAIAAALIAALALPNVAAAAPAGRDYEARYFWTGSLLRASLACDIQTDSGFKAAVATAFASISSPELIAFSKGYPETTGAWMGEGASAFNREVMAKGLPFACQDVLQPAAEVDD